MDAAVAAGTLTCLSRDEVVVSAYPPLNSFGEPRLLRSRDGGRTWQGLRVPHGAYPPQVLSRETFVAAKDGRTWFVTRDAARTWTTVTPSTDTLESLALVSRDVGFALTSRRRGLKGRVTHLLRTADGGTTWERLPVRLANFVPVALAAAHGTLWIQAPRRILRTADGGRHWDEIRVGQPPPDSARFASARAGVAPGYRGIWITRDGGVIWRWERRGRSYSYR